MRKYNILVLLFFQVFGSCNEKAKAIADTSNLDERQAISTELNHIPFDTTFKTIHIFVALCDNKYQGIVPVPPKIGN